MKGKKEQKEYVNTHKNTFTDKVHFAGHKVSFIVYVIEDPFNCHGGRQLSLASEGDRHLSHK